MSTETLQARVKELEEDLHKCRTLLWVLSYLPNRMSQAAQQEIREQLGKAEQIRANAKAEGAAKLVESEEKICLCGHPKSRHFNGTGMCECRQSSYGGCNCRRFRLPGKGGA